MARKAVDLIKDMWYLKGNLVFHCSCWIFGNSGSFWSLHLNHVDCSDSLGSGSLKGGSNFKLNFDGSVQDEGDCR